MGILLALVLTVSSPCENGKCSRPIATMQPVRTVVKKCRTTIKNRRKPVYSFLRFITRKRR